MSIFVGWSSWLFLGFFGGQRTKIQEVNRLFFIIQGNRLWVHRRYPWLTLAWQGDGRRHLKRFWPDLPKSHKFRFGRHTSQGTRVVCIVSTWTYTVVCPYIYWIMLHSAQILSPSLKFPFYSLLFLMQQGLIRFLLLFMGKKLQLFNT